MSLKLQIIMKLLKTQKMKLSFWPIKSEILWSQVHLPRKPNHFLQQNGSADILQKEIEDYSI